MLVSLCIPFFGEACQGVRDERFIIRTERSLWCRGALPFVRRSTPRPLLAQASPISGGAPQLHSGAPPLHGRAPPLHGRAPPTDGEFDLEKAKSRWKCETSPNSIDFDESRFAKVDAFLPFLKKTSTFRWNFDHAEANPRA